MTSTSRFTIWLWYVACWVLLRSGGRHVESRHVVWCTNLSVVLRLLLRAACHVLCSAIHRRITRQATFTMHLLFQHTVETRESRMMTSGSSAVQNFYCYFHACLYSYAHSPRTHIQHTSERNAKAKATSTTTTTRMGKGTIPPRQR